MDKKMAQSGKSANQKQAAKKGALMMSPEDRMAIIRKNKNFQKLIEWFLLNIPSLSGIASEHTAPRLQPMTTKPPPSAFKQKINFNQSLFTQINNSSIPPSTARIDDRFSRGKFNQYKKRIQNIPSQFKEKVRHCLSDIKSLPPLKKVLNSTYSTMGSAICDYKASFGNDGQEKAKRRIKQTSKQRQSLIQDNLNNIITSQPDALHATSLYYLLSKRWLQYPNSYKLSTKLGWKDERRIKDLLNSRNL